MKARFFVLISVFAALMGSCAGNKATAGTDSTEESQRIDAPQFNADSAYDMVAAQCDFGPRVPGTDAHARCCEWLVGKLRGYADSVIVQDAPVTTFDGVKLNAKNIVAQFNKDASMRVLLLAHWDCRPWADNDPDPAKQKQPVMGANDAASGVGVLLEMARIMKTKAPELGVDILLVDAEDWGKDEIEDSWALGTQYWAANPHVAGYKPSYGILLDMVGAQGAQFAPEYYSLQYASAIVGSVWNIAADAGYKSFFKESGGGAVTDDHVAINKAGIPCIDIIDMRSGSETGFFQYWHTTGDTMDKIDRSTLKAVGQTLINLLYQ